MTDHEKSTALIVDDNPTNLNVLFSSLSSAGYRVLIAQDGQSAVRQAQHAQPDVILLDVLMPGLDGFETCAQLKGKADTAQIPVIFMTALHEDSDKVKGFKSGAVDYVTKPLQHEEVLTRLSTQIRLRRLQSTVARKNIELEAKNRELRKSHAEISRLQSLVNPDSSRSVWPQSESTNEISRHERMTVLRSGIEGFVFHLAKGNYRAILKNLNNCMDSLANAICAHNGIIDKFLGDGIQSYFQNPKDAVHAAIDFQHQIRVYNQLGFDGMSLPITARVGLATGSVLLARVGSQSRKDSALIGDRVNVAARIQNIAPPGGLSMDETTHCLLGHFPNLTPEFISIEGKQKRELVYSVSQDCMPQLREFIHHPLQLERRS